MLLILFHLYLAVLSLALPTQLQDFCGHLYDILSLEPLAVLDVCNEFVPCADGFLFVNLVADCELFAALLLSNQ